MADNTFDNWFKIEEIHEVINTRAELLAEIIHDAETGQATLEQNHAAITSLLEEAYALGKSNV